MNSIFSHREQYIVGSKGLLYGLLSLGYYKLNSTSRNIERIRIINAVNYGSFLWMFALMLFHILIKSSLYYVFMPGMVGCGLFALMMAAGQVRLGKLLIMIVPVYTLMIYSGYAFASSKQIDGSVVVLQVIYLIFSILTISKINNARNIMSLVLGILPVVINPFTNWLFLSDFVLDGHHISTLRIIITIINTLFAFLMVAAIKSISINKLYDDDEKEVLLKQKIETKKQYIIGLEQYVNQKNEQLKTLKQHSDSTNAIKSVNETLRQKQPLSQLMDEVAQKLTAYLKSHHILVYKKLKAKDTYEVLSYYADKIKRYHLKDIAVSNTIVNECVKLKKEIHFSHIPSDYFYITESISSQKPLHLYIYPIIYKNKVSGVLEFSVETPLDKIKMQAMPRILSIIAGSISQDFFKKVNVDLLEETDNIRQQNEKLSDIINQIDQDIKEQKDIIAQCHKKMEIQDDMMQKKEKYRKSVQF